MQENDDAEKIVRTYDKTIAALKKADEDEAKTRYQKDQELWEELKKYVAIHGGFIDDTCVNIDGHIIRTRDILLYGEEAKYKNLEITKIQLLINGQEVKDNNAYVPLGARIKSIDVYIYYDINDSGGIEKLEVYHKNLDYVTSTQTDNDIEAVIIKYDQDNNGNADEGVIHYQKIFNDNYQLYAKDIIEDIIQGFNIYVSKTPIEKYKYYPRLKESLDVEIVSSGNIITNNIIQVLKHINIIPVYSLYYKFTKDNNYLSFVKNSIETDYILLNDLTIKDNSEYNSEHSFKVIPNDIDINIVNSESNNATTPFKTLYIAVPNVYKINKLYAINESNEKFNWTGAVLMKNTYINLVAYKNLDNENSYTTKYNLYKIIDLNGFKCKKINIVLLPFDESISYEVSLLTGNRSDIDLIINETNSTNINDEEFNNLYWVNFEENENVANINNILKPLIYNCTNR